MYSADGRKQVPGSENILVYVALHSTIRNLYGKDSVVLKSTGLLPGDVIMTRCRSFSFDTGTKELTAFNYPRYMARRGFIAGHTFMITSGYRQN